MPYTYAVLHEVMRVRPLAIVTVHLVTEPIMLGWYHYRRKYNTVYANTHMLPVFPEQGISIKRAFKSCHHSELATLPKSKKGTK